MSDVVYVHGYGAKKHIADPACEPDRFGDRRTLCNNYGRERSDDLPLCKICARKAGVS